MGRLLFSIRGYFGRHALRQHETCASRRLRSKREDKAVWTGSPTTSIIWIPDVSDRKRKSRCLCIRFSIQPCYRHRMQRTLKFHYHENQAMTMYPSFYPRGIVTNSQNDIIVTDPQNNCVHIIDHVGQFIRFISSTEILLKAPY